MENIVTCSTLRCLKPSGLIDWVNCRFCNRWVYIKCANSSRTEDWSLAEVNCCRMSLVITIPQCHVDNFRPDTLFNSGVVHLKRVPKILGSPQLKTEYPKLRIFVKLRQILPCGAYCSPVSADVLEEPLRGGKPQSLSTSVFGLVH